MAANPLKQLYQYGQSFWYDNIARGLIENGHIRRMIEEDGLRGITSNPAIFQKAIDETSDYDEAISHLADQGNSADEIYETLAVEDIQNAADLLRPVYNESGGDDGFVSLEVSPRLAHQTDETIREARRLAAAVNRPNLMIKIPATPEGMPAIEELIAGGYKINVTLIFSIGCYEQVAEAYIRGLERRSGSGDDLSIPASVASVFISRIDTLVDDMLANHEDQTSADPIKGKAAVATAKLCYLRFREIFDGDRFSPLRGGGGRVQRVLWGSTSTKNPDYSDVAYIEPLIGPDSINTIPQATVDAFRDHGKAGETITEDLSEAKRTYGALDKLGIDMEDVGGRLQADGVTKFVEPFDKLMESLERKRRALAAT